MHKNAWKYTIFVDERTQQFSGERA